MTGIKLNRQIKKKISKIGYWSINFFLLENQVQRKLYSH